jgi:transcriptional regulator of arginine metabolism
MAVPAHKRFRQGQILKVLSAEPVASQDELRRQLVHLGLRVTQATLSRDLRELRLVKTAEGYKQLAQAAQESAESPAHSRLERAAKSFLTDIRPAQNMLVLKTPPGGAQPLAAAVDSEKWKEVSGTLAGDDTVLIICPSRSARAAVQKRIEGMLR